MAQPEAAKLALQEGRFEEAARLYQALAKQFPEEPMLHFNAGLALFSAKKYTPALKELQIALKAQPANPQVNFITGSVLARLDRRCDAAALLEKAGPVTEYLEELADAQYACGAHAKAAATYQLLTRRLPKSSRAWYGLGMAQLSSGNEAAAKEAFAQLSSLGPSAELRKLEHEVARGLWNAKRYADAREALLRVRGMGPAEAALEYELGDCAEKLEGPVAALSYYQRAVALDPKFIPAQGALGRALITLERPREAIPHLEIAAKANIDKSLWAALANSYRAVGRNADAAAALQRAR